MYRLRLIVCLVLSDVNVFLKLNCKQVKKEKKNLSMAYSLQLFCVFCIEIWRAFCFTMQKYENLCTSILKSIFSVYIVLAWINVVWILDVNTHFFFPTHLTAVTCNSLIMPNIKDNVLSTAICLFHLFGGVIESLSFKFKLFFYVYIDSKLLKGPWKNIYKQQKNI